MDTISSSPLKSQPSIYSFNQIKDKFASLKTKIRMQDEPVQDLSAVISILKTTSADPAYQNNESQKKIFYSDLVPGFVKTLVQNIRQKSTKLEFSDLLRELPPILAEILVGEIENEDLLDGIGAFFDFSSKLHKNHCQKEGDLTKIQMEKKEELSPSDLLFRQQLKVGQMLDCIKVDPDFKIKSWSQCRIIEKNDSDKIKVTFINETSKCDRYLSILSDEIAQFESKTKEDVQWRDELKEGDNLDCYDSSMTWYGCTVLQKDFREIQKVKLPMLHLAFRVNHPDGDKEEDGQKFFGWGKEFDEWIQLYSPRVQKFHTHVPNDFSNQTTKVQNSIVEQKKAQENFLDDSLDHLIKSKEGGRIFAVLRDQSRSELLVDFLNQFGLRGGFDKMIQVIETQSDNQNLISLLSKYINCFALAIPNYHKDFYDEFCPKMENLVLKCLHNATSQQLRNTKKEGIDEIVDGLFDKIMKRKNTKGDTILKGEKLMMLCKIGKVCLEQNFLERRIDGVKFLSDVCSQCLSLISTSMIMDQSDQSEWDKRLKIKREVVDFIKVSDILATQIFSKDRAHIELIQRTEKVLSLLFSKESLAEEDIDKIMQTSDFNDGEFREETFKVLQGSAQYMSKQARMMVLDRLILTHPSLVTQRHLRLISNLCSTIKVDQDQTIVDKGLDYLWSKAFQREEDIAFMTVAAQGVLEITLGQSMEKKLEISNRLAQCIVDKNRAHLAISVLKTLMEKSFTKDTGHPLIENLADFIDYLETHHHIFAAVLSDLKAYMGLVKQKLKNQKIEDDQNDVQKSIIVGCFPHEDRIQQVLSFLKFCAQGSPRIQIDQNSLNILWTILVNESQLQSDNRALYQWLRDAIDQTQRQIDSRTRPIIEMETLTKFFNENLDVPCKGTDQFKFLCLHGFVCIMSFFVLINQSKNKLVKISDEYGIYQKDSKLVGEKKMTSFNSQTGPKFEQYSFSNNDKPGPTASQTQGPIFGPHLPGTYGPNLPDSQSTSTQNQGITSEDDGSCFNIIVKQNPCELDGYNLIWRIATESTSKLVIDNASKLLIQMHQELDQSIEDKICEFDDIFINKCFSIIKDQMDVIKSRSNDENRALQIALDIMPNTASVIQQLRVYPFADRKIIRTLFILKQHIRCSERNGTFSVTPHLALSQGTVLDKIQIQNNITKGGDFQTRFEVIIDSHTSIWDLKKLLGIKVMEKTGQQSNNQAVVGIHPSKIRLFQTSNSQDLRDINNGMTLSQLKCKNNESFTVFTKSTALRTNAPIVIKDPQSGSVVLSQRAKSVIQEIFERFSLEQSEEKPRFMNIENVAIYKSVSQDKPYTIEDKEVLEFWGKYCDDQIGGVALQNFEQFVIDSCVTGLDSNVRTTLKNLGYYPDLVKIPKDTDHPDILQIRGSIEMMPRYKISANRHHFEILLDLTDIPNQVGIRANELVQFLATSPQDYENVLWLDKLAVDGQFNWGQLFETTNLNKLKYELQIIEAILVKDQDTRTTQDWIQQFLKLRGLRELQIQLDKAQERIENDKNPKLQEIVVMILRIIKIFISSTFQQETMAVEEQRGDTEEETKDEQFSTPQKQVKSAEKTGKVSSFYFGDITQEALFGDTISVTPVNETEVVQQPKEQVTLTIDQSLRQVIVSQIDPESLLRQANLILQSIIQQKQVSAEERVIVDNALNLWCTLTTNKETIIIPTEFFVSGIIECEDLKVRENYELSFNHWAKQEPRFLKAIGSLIPQVMGQISAFQSRGKSCRSFLLLVQDFLENFIKPDKDKKIDQDQSSLILLILEKTIVQLNSHESREVQGSIAIDWVLKLLIDIIKLICEKGKGINDLKPFIRDTIITTELIRIVFSDCLFGHHRDFNNSEESDQSRKTKCKVMETRKSGQKLLQEVIQFLDPIQTADFISKYMYPLVKQVKRPGKWKHLPGSKHRYGDYIGINNLGCICYMISMLQQFYMVPQFRHLLLKAEDNTPPNLVSYKDELVDDNMLRQLQMMFGFLNLSQKHSFNPLGFCFSFKEFDGSPTKIGEQKDSQEFLNIFFERLENLLRPTSQRFLLRDIFSGNLCSQLICQSCGKVKTRLEMFYNLSVQVKGIDNIYDSLEKFIKGQTIEDYFCDGCQQRVDVVKRSLLGEMPNVLIVHLQRIFFCFEKLQNDKVNSKFEFPNVLDLKRFSYKENANNMDGEEQELAALRDLEDDQYLYKLVGVNIHVGTADHGHYYSIINTNRETKQKDENKGEIWGKVEGDDWKVFDDSNVKFFSFKLDLKKEAFGGDQSEEKKANSDALSDKELAAFLSSGSQSYGKSAYMLIYERKSKKEIEQLRVDGEGKEQLEKVEFEKVDMKVPEWLRKCVEEDNAEFLVDSQLFNSDFFDVHKSLLKHIGGDLVLTSHLYDYHYQCHFINLKRQTLQVAGKVVMDMLAYFEQNGSLAETVNQFSSIVTFCDSHYALKRGESSLVAQFVRDYFINQCTHFFKIMFECVDSSSRNHVGKMASIALSRLFKLISECDEESRVNCPQVREVIETAEGFLTICLVAITGKECQRNWTKLENFFKMLFDIAQSSITAAQYFMDKCDIISDLIDFMLGNNSPRAVGEPERRVAMGGSVSPPFQPLYSLISFFIRMTHTPQMNLENRLESHQTFKHKGSNEQIKTYFLSDEAMNLISKTLFLESVIFDAKYDENSQFAYAMAHLCFENLKFSRKLSKKLLKCISLSNNEQVGRLLEIVSKVLRVQDRFQTHRLEILLGFGFIMHDKQETEGSFKQYGLALMSRAKVEDTIQILTPLDARQNDDSLLNLLWKHKGKFDSFTITFISSLVQLMKEDKVINRYLRDLTAPNYLMGSYVDWFKPYLDKQLEETKKNSSGMGNKEKEERIVKVLSMWEQIDQIQ